MLKINDDLVAHIITGVRNTTPIECKLLGVTEPETVIELDDGRLMYARDGKMYVMVQRDREVETFVVEAER